MSTDSASVPAIPPLGGLCTYDEASRTGLSVEGCVEWLKRLHYVWKRLHQIFTAHITAEPIYELKTAFSLHAHLCAEHAQAIRDRVSEMREPPLGLEVVPDATLEIICDEVLCCPTTRERCYGLYGVLLPALSESIQQYLNQTNRLADAPSVRILRFAQLELADMQAFGAQTLTALEGSGAIDPQYASVLRMAGNLTPAPLLGGEGGRNRSVTIRGPRFSMTECRSAICGFGTRSMRA